MLFTDKWLQGSVHKQNRININCPKKNKIKDTE